MSKSLLGDWIKIDSVETLSKRTDVEEVLVLRGDGSYTYTVTRDEVWAAGVDSGRECHEKTVAKGTWKEDDDQLVLHGKGVKRWNNKPSPLMTSSLAFLDSPVVDRLPSEQAASPGDKNSGSSEVEHNMLLSLPLPTEGWNKDEEESSEDDD